MGRQQPTQQQRVRSGVERRTPDAERAADLDADVSGAASFHAREPAAEEPAIARQREFPVDQRVPPGRCVAAGGTTGDRKSTRLNSSHVANSYAVFCLKKKT